MHEFFRGSHRKTGLVMLVLAMGLANGWLRSFVVGDILRFGLAGQEHLMVSAAGQVGWESYPGDGRWLFELRHHPMSDKSIARSVSDQMFCKLPYWSLVLPVTLLSAWLLLIKPRPAKSAKEAVPVIADVASHSSPDQR